MCAETRPVPPPATAEEFRPLPCRAVCNRCGSDDVCRDAVARWNQSANAWTLAATYDDGTCQACGAEGHDVIDYVPVAPVPGSRVRITTRPRIGGDPHAGRAGAVVRANHVSGGLYVRLDPLARERIEKIELVALEHLEVAS